LEQIFVSGAGAIIMLLLTMLIKGH
jgi:hypothetical protein